MGEMIHIGTLRTEQAVYRSRTRKRLQDSLKKGEWGGTEGGHPQCDSAPGGVDRAMQQSTADAGDCTDRSWPSSKAAKLGK